ncbi:replication protein [Enterococcus faecalis]|uniref:replication protein n=1 Tax=Enterococcus faecalis TaxID=1351 RepID=UPI003DA24647
MVKNTRKQPTPRYRNWVFIIYPDSAPENWRDIVTNIGVPWAHSPLHDKDVEEYGGAKKPHYHCVIKYPSLKTYRQLLSLTGKLSAPNPQYCESLIGKVRYFLHLDSPHKYQYSKDEIQAFNGFDIELYLKPSKTEKDALLKEARQFISENNITELAELVDYTDLESPSWTRIINSSTYVINSYITSRRNNPKHKFSRRNADLKLLRDIIRENDIQTMAELMDYMDSFKIELHDLLNDCYLEVSDYLTSREKPTKSNNVKKHLGIPKQTNIIPLVPKGIDLELWELTIREYQASCL